ncbi:class C sortase [Streptococcus sp. E17BB]|uniref:class C sortase n=1 Tax=Streptococcus sp. E17BB TaxID=3278714 RepID=UPI00359EA071
MKRDRKKTPPRHRRSPEKKRWWQAILKKGQPAPIEKQENLLLSTQEKADDSVGIPFLEEAQQPIVSKEPISMLSNEGQLQMSEPQQGSLSSVEEPGSPLSANEPILSGEEKVSNMSVSETISEGVHTEMRDDTRMEDSLPEAEDNGPVAQLEENEGDTGEISMKSAAVDAPLPTPLAPPLMPSSKIEEDDNEELIASSQQQNSQDVSVQESVTTAPHTISSSSSHKRKRKKFLFVALFLAGFLIMSYPFVSQLYYRIQANNVNTQFDQAVAKLDNEELSRRYKLAQAFNAALKPRELQDPFTDDEKKEGMTEYANMLKINEQIGYVSIPKIDQKIPMFVGVSDAVLEKGAGLLEGTSLPVGGSNTHTVISAHRGLPNARLFTDLDKLKKGDVFYIHVLDTVLAYEVDQIKVVEPDNFDPILIEEGKDYATLLTCTPYMINTQRLLVRGKRIPYAAPVEEKMLETSRSNQLWKMLFGISVGMILILLYLIYHNRKQLAQNKRLEEN